MAGKNLRVNLIANTSQFKSAMAESSNQIKLLNSEFRSAAAETDEYGNKLDTTGAKKKQLTGIIQQYTQRVKAIKTEQAHWTRELEKGNITEEEHARIQQDLARRLNNTEAEMKRYEGQLKRLNAEGKTTRMTYEEFDKQFRQVGQTMKTVGASTAAIAGGMLAAIVKPMKDAVEVTRDFDTEMSKVQALTGATAGEMGQLRDMAKDLGSSTVFSATEAAEAISFLGMAGFDTNQIMSATPGLLDLAAAAQMDLGRAADITSNILSGFGMEAEEAGRVSDVLAKASSNANTNVEQMGDSMKTVAPIAATLGMSLEDMAAGTMLMSDAGIQGSESGRMLRQGLLRLSKPTGQAADLIEELGINVFDADGNMKSLDQVVGELQGGLDGMTAQAQAAALATLFGSESTAGWSALLSAGSDTLKAYTEDLNNAEGAAAKMAEIMQDNLQGSITQLQSGIEGLQIRLGEALMPTIREGVDWFTDLVEKINEMDDATIQSIAGTALAAAGILGVVTAIGAAVAAIGTLMAVAGPVGLAIVGTTALLGALGLATYGAQQKSEALRKEQEKAEAEARRYGAGVREGTIEATKGYVDLYEGAKLEMLKLRTMSGEEAEATKQNVVNAFREMGDMVVAELEAFADDFDRVVREIYGIYEEAGQERAEEIGAATREQTEAMIQDYQRASETIGQIVQEFGSDISKYPEEVRKTYEANLAIMQEGVGVFAVNYEDALRVRNRIAEDSDTILIEEAKKYAKEIADTHTGALDSINEQYLEQMAIIEQFKILYPENADLYDEMMRTLAASTTEEIAKINAVREESTRLLMENTDTTGKLIDFQTGKVMERLETEEWVTKGIGGSYEKRSESDEDYYKRWLKTNDSYLSSLGESTDKALEYIEKSAYDWAIQMGKTEVEAEQFARDIREGVLTEIDGITEAGEIGENTGQAHADGILSTLGENEKAGADITESALDQIERGKPESEEAGKDKGDAHRLGLESTKGANDAVASQLSIEVSNILGSTTDGGGGEKAGNDLRAGLLSTQGAVETAGVRVATSGKDGLSSVDTSSTGRDFVSGFSNSINDNDGSIFRRAWNLGKSALSALKQSIQSASPSKLTGEEGINFVDGFQLAITDGTGKVVNSVTELGTAAVNTLAESINRQSDDTNIATIRLANRIKKATEDSNREIASINKKAQAEAKQLERRTQEDIRLIHAKAKEGKRKLTQAETVRIQRMEEDSAKKIKNIYDKSAKDIERVEKDLSKTISDIREDEFNKSLEWIETRKRSNELSIQDELDAWGRVYRRHEEGSKQREEAEKNIYRIKKEVHDQLNQLNEDYLKQVEDINNKLIAEENKLNEAYQKAVDDRTRALYSFVGIFDEIKEKSDVSGQQLIDNLRGQVNVFSEWSEDIKSLASRGIDEGLLAELRNMGPKAAAEIAALNSLSDEQLSEYTDLWLQKHELAREQAVDELEGLREDTEKQIEELHKQTESQLELLQKEWISKVENIRTGTRNEMSYLRGDLRIIGEQSIAGLISGLESQRGPLMEKARSIADSVIAEMQRALDINSPSGRAEREIGKWIPEGVAVGIDKNSGKMKNALLAMNKDSIEAFQRQMSLFKMDFAKLGLSVGQNKQSLKIEHEIKQTGLEQKFDALINLLEKAVLDKDKPEINQTNHYHGTGPLSPSESARKNKQMLRQAALEWR